MFSRFRGGPERATSLPSLSLARREASSSWSCWQPRVHPQMSPLVAGEREEAPRRLRFESEREISPIPMKNRASDSRESPPPLRKSAPSAPLLSTSSRTTQKRACCQSLRARREGKRTRRSSSRTTFFRRASFSPRPPLSSSSATPRPSLKRPCTAAIRSLMDVCERVPAEKKKKKKKKKKRPERKGEEEGRLLP